MFTGIVAGLAPIEAIEEKSGLMRFGMRMSSQLAHGLERGASVALDGVCLTALEQQDGLVFFEAMGETLSRTTLGTAAVGRQINIERSHTADAEIGGHVVSGHVDGKAKIVTIDQPENNYVITFSAPAALMKYVFTKGFIALDGASLTVVDVDYSASTFTVWFIPETLRVTTFGIKQVGDEVNIEVESNTRVLVETVERLLPTLLEQQKK